MPLHILVVEGNLRADRERHRATYGLTPAASYAALLRHLEPEARCDIVTPADEDAALPDPAGLDSYDGVVLTGSGLNIWKEEPAAMRQVDLVRAVLKAGVPVFGSCWGLQVAAVATGGTVHQNPRGRELGIARDIALTDEGRVHPLYTGKAAVFSSPCVHNDEIATLPPDTVVLAGNRMSAVQAAEIRHEGGVVWGVQYHPEFSLNEITAFLRRYRPTLLAENFFREPEAVDGWLADLAALVADPLRADLSWRYGIGPDILDSERRTLEIRNFLTRLVQPTRSARGRA